MKTMKDKIRYTDIFETGLDKSEENRTHIKEDLLHLNPPVSSANSLAEWVFNHTLLLRVNILILSIIALARFTPMPSTHFNASISAE